MCSIAPGGHLSARQEPPDSITPLSPLRVQVLRAPVLTQLVPFAISTLNEDELRGRNAGFSIEEALQGVAGVQVQNRYNFAVGERISVRGIGSRAQFGVRGIRILVDGIPATVADGQSTLDHLDLGSLGRLEVLRGPSASIYGNASGGVLSFSSRVVNDTPLRQEITALAGSDGFSRLQSTTAGMSGQTSYLLSLGRFDYDGFRTDGVRPNQDTYGQAQRWNLNATLARPLGNGELRVALNGVDLDAENPGSMNRETFDSGSKEARGFNISQGTGKAVEQGQLGSSWRGSSEWGRIEVAGYGLSRSIVNPIPGTVVDLDRKAGGGRVLVGSLSEDPTEIQWTFGSDFDIQSDDRRNFDNDDGSKGELELSQTERVRAAGVFAQLQVPLGEQVRVTGGLRYDDFSFEADDRFLSDGTDNSGTRNLSAWSPSIGLATEIDPEFVVFTSVSSSFETPTTTELANQPSGSGGFNPDLNPQDGVTVEAGLRSTPSPRFAAEVTLFRTRLEDQLLPFEVPSDPGRTFFRNAGSSIYKGGELSLWYSTLTGFESRLSYSYTNAEFDEFRIDGDVFDGNDVPGVAPSQLELSGKVTRRHWSGELGIEFVDAVPVDDAGSAEADSYWLFDVHAEGRGIALGQSQLTPIAGVDNLFDTDYSSSVAVNAFGSRFFEPGPGRTFFVGLRVAWDRR